ncbi:MAG TPA: nicotinate (nicotinamide) nucleotide adenylyltransferase [Lentisphaeria bacterium]|nr:MAG: nicotinate (nicotinamide) nucleotide adenylyltransferase [Lentisphaerae bacterium GWF2_38_69]HBM17533.1 nicotinate (nicotinamide) nucleotide adenylyltransferase [Lentisphaeria bacterium]
MRIGLFGGTFDPIHIGHLNLAKALIEKSYLDHIIFVPAAKPPHKPEKPVTVFSDRYKMVELAIEEVNYFSISDIEEQRLPIPSYTFDTLRKVKTLYPKDILYLIIGEDSLLQIHTWYRGRELIDLCEIITYPRPNENCTLEKLESIWSKKTAERLFRTKVELPLIDVSSTQIRQGIKTEKTKINVIPEKVMKYIREHKLYL